MDSFSGFVFFFFYLYNSLKTLTNDRNTLQVDLLKPVGHVTVAQKPVGGSRMENISKTTSRERNNKNLIRKEKCS